MPAVEEIHVGDIGTVFEVTVTDKGSAIDISTATVKQLIFGKPDGSKLTKTAGFKTDGTDGVLTYTTTSGDLDIVGNWRLQARAVFGVNDFTTSIAPFQVYPNI